MKKLSFLFFAYFLSLSLLNNASEVTTEREQSFKDFRNKAIKDIKLNDFKKAFNKLSQNAKLIHAMAIMKLHYVTFFKGGDSEEQDFKKYCDENPMFPHILSRYVDLMNFILDNYDFDIALKEAASLNEYIIKQSLGKSKL